MDKYEVAEKMRKLCPYAVRNTEMIPCHTTRFTVDGYLNTKEKIKEYIRLGRKHSKKGLAMFSVTEMDIYHKEWLAIAKASRIAQIVETKSRLHGDYKCWLIFYQSRG